MIIKHCGVKSILNYARGLLLIICLSGCHGNVISQTNEVVTTEKKELNDKNYEIKDCCKDKNNVEKDEDTLGEETELEGTWVGVMESYEKKHFKLNGKPLIIREPIIYVFHKNILATTSYDDEFGMMLTGITFFKINKNSIPKEITIITTIKRINVVPFTIKTTDIYKIDGNMLTILNGSNTFTLSESSFIDSSEIITIKKLKRVR